MNMSASEKALGVNLLLNYINIHTKRIDIQTVLTVIRIQLCKSLNDTTHYENNRVNGGEEQMFLRWDNLFCEVSCIVKMDTRQATYKLWIVYRKC